MHDWMRFHVLSVCVDNGVFQEKFSRLPPPPRWKVLESMKEWEEEKKGKRPKRMHLLRRLPSSPHWHSVWFRVDSQLPSTEEINKNVGDQYKHFYPEFQAIQKPLKGLFMSQWSTAGHKWKSKHTGKERKNQLFFLPSPCAVSVSSLLSHPLKPPQREGRGTPALGSSTCARGADSLSLFFFDFTPRTGTSFLFTPGTQRNRKEIILHITWQGLSLLPPARAPERNWMLKLRFFWRSVLVSVLYS